jgi:hypothetical protein
MGATVPQMGATFSIICRWGLRIFVHTQMGAEFKILFLILMQIVDPRAPQARILMQVDSFETD